MAGIGFQLRRLAREDTISSIVASAGHAAMIAAGPWLFTIVAISGITIATDQVVGIEALATFRAIVIYAFAISLVFAAPVTMVATRLVGDALWLKQPGRVRALLLVSIWVVMVPAIVGLTLVQLIFRLPFLDALVLGAMTLAVCGIWVAIAFCGAIRDYRGVTISFIVGLTIALVGCVGVALLGGRTIAMGFAFTAGLTAIFIGLVSRVYATFPHAVANPLASLTTLMNGLRRYWALSLGAFLGTAGIWIDKVAFWFSPVGEQVSNGLRHAPLYDSTMFISSLVLVPALSSFVVKLETGFFERYQQFFATIASHGTLSQIEESRQRLARYTMDSLTLITVSLAGLAAIVLLTAPIIVEAVGLQFRQIAILRYGALGTVFQFVYIAATSMLLFFDRRFLYLAIQIGYFGCSLGFAVVSIILGQDFYGVGFFAASLLAAAVAFYAADRTFQQLNFLTFIGNNPSVRGASGQNGWQRPAAEATS
jgi:polysaccharide biosynthesis protein PelG